MRFINPIIRLLFCECLIVSLSFLPVSAQHPADNAQQGSMGDPVDPTQQSAVSGQNSEGQSGVSTQPGAPAVSMNGSGAQGTNGTQLRIGNPSESVPAMRIAPGDELDMTIFGVPEMTEHLRVSNSGDVSLPLIGKLHLAGLSSDQAQALLEQRLANGNFVNDAHVSLYVKEYITEGISLIGEVNRPGVYSVLAGNRLLDLIQTAGGLTPRAGRTITISHRADPKHPIIVSSSNDSDIGKNNIELLPGDTVVVSKAGIVYVVGEVNRPGGFVMEGNKITALQALVWAAGPTHGASLNGAKMIRRTPDGLKDMTLPLKKILDAKAPDVQLQPDDIIWIPGSKTKGLASGGSGAILSMLTSLVIYHL